MNTSGNAAANTSVKARRLPGRLRAIGPKATPPAPTLAERLDAVLAKFVPARVLVGTVGYDGDAPIEGRRWVPEKEEDASWDEFSSSELDPGAPYVIETVGEGRRITINRKDGARLVGEGQTLAEAIAVLEAHVGA